MKSSAATSSDVMVYCEAPLHFLRILFEMDTVIIVFFIIFCDRNTASKVCDKTTLRVMVMN